MTFTLDRVDAEHVGGLMFLLEMATAYAGEFYGIDAFNQPGVELGKQFTYGMLGPPAHRRFQAGYSMRDVEPGVLVKPRGPNGERVSGAGDMA